jgi:CRP-like cAMP-binding protein
MTVGLSTSIVQSTIFLLGAGSWSAWVVPAILLVVVIAASWLGIRWAFSEELDALRSAPLFNGLSTRQMRSILRSAVPAEFPPGATIVREGEAGDAFYLVKEGTAKVVVGDNERATLGPRSYFGEVSVIDGGARTATVIAIDRVLTLQITSRALVRTFERYPSITRLIFLRLRSLLGAEGDSVPYPEDAPVDLSVLAELCRRLRGLRDLEWSPAGPPRRWARLRR